MSDSGRPLYRIGVVAGLLKVHPQTLRVYERKGLLRPSRTVGRTRLYSPDDVDEIGRVLRLTRDLGVNLAGIEVILRLRRRLIEMQRELENLLTYVRDGSGGGEAPDGGAPREALVRAAVGQLRPIDLD